MNQPEGEGLCARRTARDAVGTPRLDAVDHVRRPASRRRGTVVGVAVLAAVWVGAGILAGVGLAGAGSAPARAVGLGPNGLRSGSSVAPGGAGAMIAAGPTHLTLLFVRTTSSGVTVRVYSEAGDPSPTCPGSAPCPLPAPTPDPAPWTPTTAATSTTTTTSTSANLCPADTACARPSPVLRRGQVDLPAPAPVASSSPGGAVAAPVPVCSPLVVELSTDRAVSVGSAVGSTGGALSSGAVAVLGGGSFGAAEGEPVSWVAVVTGATTSSVHLSSGSSVIDQMTPVAGVALLVQPGTESLAGADVVGVDQTGSAGSTVPAGQVSGGTACASPPPTTTTTTAPPNSTTTTVPPTTTTTTSPPGPSTTTSVPAPTIATSPAAARLPDAG